MSEPDLVPCQPTVDDVQYLEDRLYEHNSGATGISDGQLLAFLSRDASSCPSEMPVAPELCS